MPSDDPMGTDPGLGYRCPRCGGGCVGKCMRPDPVARDKFSPASVAIGAPKAQGATAFIAAADAYFASFRRPNERLSEAAPLAADEHRHPLDIDTGPAAAFASRGIAEPDDPSERMWLYLALLDEMLDR
jgi:hypothetical protein